MLPLKKCDLLEIHDIPVKKNVTYLGVILDFNQNNRCSINFEPIIKQVASKFNMWLMRDLSIYGRTLLTKAEGISRSVYVSLALNMPNKISKKLDRSLFNFIWKHKAHYLRKDVLCNQKGNGGLEVLTFETINNMFKINWLCRLVKEKTSLWNTIPKYIFNQIGGINFLLKCNYKPEKLPIKLSDFHKQALLSWRLIYKRGFSPTSCYLWNNQYIKHRNKSLFLKNWYEQGIIWTNQLINAQGEIFTYNEFIEKYTINTSLSEFTKICKAIPNGIQHFLKNHQYNSQIQRIHNKIYVGEINITEKPCSNKYIRNLIQPPNRPIAITHWNSLYDQIDWGRAWLVGEKLCIFNKVKEISFKILHNIYPAKITLQRFKLDIDYNCEFCKSHSETIPHLFYHCIHSQSLWSYVQHLIHNKTGHVISLQESDILFYFKDTTIPTDLSLLVQTIIFLAKYHIHKHKFSQTIPNGLHFNHDLQQYINTIKYVNSTKAIKTYNSFLKYNFAH